MADFFIGSFVGPRSEEAKAKGFLGYNGKYIFLSFTYEYDFSNISFLTNSIPLDQENNFSFFKIGSQFIWTFPKKQ